MAYFNEKRASSRLDKQIECSIVLPDASTLRGSFEDISNNGARLKVSPDEDLQTATAINLKLHHDYFEIPLSATITRLLPDGIAIKFSDNQSLRLISRFHQSLDSDGCESIPSSFCLSLNKISRRWGDNIALNEMSATFGQQEIIALIGPSGSGKSTLLKLLSGVTKPSTGEVMANNHSLGDLSAEQLRKFRAQCGVIQQKHLLVPQNTVHQNVVSGLVAHWPFYKVIAAALWNSEKRRVKEILESLGIADYQWHLASQLSVGQQQRVAVARALISSPDIILADEPTASLDPVTAMSVTRNIINHTEKRKALLIFCTHHLELIRSHCTRAIGLRKGHIHFDTSPENMTDELIADLYKGMHEKH